MSTRKTATKSIITAACLSFCLTGMPGTTYGAEAHAATSSPAILTLDHLKNASYAIPDLACGYTTVKLKNGAGETDGVHVVFGRAVFGTIGKDKTTTAVVHLAYRTDELGWAQQLVFIQQQGGQLLQVAEYGLDEREQLKEIAIRNGQVTVETAAGDAGDLIAKDKVTNMKLAQTGAGCELQVSEWDRDPGTGKLVPHRDLAPYLAEVEDRIGKCWTPTQKDRSEHVAVTFKINPSGEVTDVHVSSSSEVQTADLAAVEAIEQAAPFPPLPQSTEKPLPVSFEFQATVSGKNQ